MDCMKGLLIFIKGEIIVTKKRTVSILKADISPMRCLRAVLEATTKPTVQKVRFVTEK